MTLRSQSYKRNLDLKIILKILDYTATQMNHEKVFEIIIESNTNLSLTLKMKSFIAVSSLWTKIPKSTLINFQLKKDLGIFAEVIARSMLVISIEIRGHSNNT